MQCSSTSSISRTCAPWSRILCTMSLPTRRARIPRGSRSLFTLLAFLLLLTLPQHLAEGPQCPRVEVIAKLKNQKEVCLDPEAPLMKKIIQKILDSGNKKTKRNALAVEKSPGVQ